MKETTYSAEPFNHIMDVTTEKQPEKTSGISYRSIVKKDGKYLVIRSNKGDIIFPGGRREDGETIDEALARELKEETGYECSSEYKYLGNCVLIKDDRFNNQITYETDLRYYSCQVKDLKYDQALTRTEEKLQIESLWMTKEEIIDGNRAYLKTRVKRDHWVDQMTWLLDKV